MSFIADIQKLGFNFNSNRNLKAFRVRHIKRKNTENRIQIEVLRNQVRK